MKIFRFSNLFMLLVVGLLVAYVVIDAHISKRSYYYPGIAYTYIPNNWTLWSDRMGRICIFGITIIAVVFGVSLLNQFIHKDNYGSTKHRITNAIALLGSFLLLAGITITVIAAHSESTSINCSPKYLSETPNPPDGAACGL